MGSWIIPISVVGSRQRRDSTGLKGCSLLWCCFDLDSRSFLISGLPRFSYTLANINLFIHSSLQYRWKYGAQLYLVTFRIFGVPRARGAGDAVLTALLYRPILNRAKFGVTSRLFALKGRYGTRRTGEHNRSCVVHWEQCGLWVSFLTVVGPGELGSSNTTVGGPPRGSIFFHRLSQTLLVGRPRT